MGYALLFIVFTVAVGLVELLRQGVFVAYRKTQYSLAIEVVAGLRLPLLFAFLSLGAFGIFVSWGLAGVTALVVGVLLVMMIQRTYRPVPSIRGRVVGDMVRFSLGNYVAESFREIPGFVLPIIVVSVFAAKPESGSGTDMGAYFYIAWTMASVVMMISYATGSSLLAEGSLEPGRFRSNATRAVRFMLLLLAPAIVLVFLFGDRVLTWFGEGYHEKAFPLLCVLSVSAVPIAVNTIYVTQKRIQRKMWPVVCVYAFVAAFTVAVGYVLMDTMELLGIGIAWLAGNCLVAVVAGLLMTRGWLQARREKNQGNADASTS
jgi:O-antigen/teichoic acid export membrane protein